MESKEKRTRKPLNKTRMFVIGIAIGAGIGAALGNMGIGMAIGIALSPAFEMVACRKLGKGSASD